MSVTTISLTKPAYAWAASRIQNPYRPGLSALIILAGDILGLRLLLWGFSRSRFVLRDAPPSNWGQFWPLLPLFLALYWFFDAYPGVNVSPVDEIRRISLANASVFAFIAVVLGLNGARLPSQWLCLSACVAASVAIPTIRSLVRGAGSRFGWWGYPVVLFGDGEITLSVLRKLKSDRHLGLRPVAVVSDRGSARQLQDVAICESEELDRIAAYGVRHAVIIAPELSQPQFVDALERVCNAFPHLVIIPKTDFIGKVEADTQGLMGVRALQVRNNLLLTGSRIAKRTIDFGFCLALIPVVLPLIAMISALVILESGFPVFYSQKRVGHNGCTFHIWKFRTMVHNAAEILERSLASSPELRKEWAENQKLRQDPRITRIGKVLRKASLDELPQLWNIFKGEMSLVGPRPIVHDEIAKYREAYPLYAKATPGLTGLWQVSGRNHTTYEERIACDSYYVRNWSVWMDIYLLARTVNVVLTGHGAY
jgi:Undecaprenyl-phosphate galactose phosphotransferase WbaP